VDFTGIEEERVLDVLAKRIPEALMSITCAGYSVSRFSAR